MSEELVPGKTCWLKAELHNIGEDGLLHLTLRNIISFTFNQGSEPQLEVEREHIRQRIDVAVDVSTLAALTARLEERKMCVFHEFSSRCNCFHCHRIAALEDLIRQEKEKME